MKTQPYTTTHRKTTPENIRFHSDAAVVES
jgi:hypothetical protein